MQSKMHKAGWIFNLDSAESLQRYIRDGVYATKIKPPKNNGWSVAYWGTLADYASMKAGQLIYFFIRRKIYGIGELVNIEGSRSCVFRNFREASLPQIPDDYVGNNESFYQGKLFYHEENIWNRLVGKGDPRFFQQRWLCTFKPCPVFYDGIDMDAILKADSTHRDLRGLRTFSGVSFMKLSPSENSIFQKYIENHTPEVFADDNSYVDQHQSMAGRYSADYNFELADLVRFNAAGEAVRSEMLLEAYILYGLTNSNEHIKGVFGEWDYFSHQVTASPYKPVEYMDKMDICGYKGGDNGFWGAEKYLLIENKKGVASDFDIKQTQKYIEWLNWEYKANGRVDAFLVASDFKISQRPDNVKLIKYRVMDDKIYFEVF